MRMHDNTKEKALPITGYTENSQNKENVHILIEMTATISKQNRRDTVIEIQL